MIEPGQLSPAWGSSQWRDALVLAIDQFHPDSSDHRPQTRAKLAYTPDRPPATFDVRDRFRKSVQVWRSNEPPALGELGWDRGGIKFSSTEEVWAVGV